jgi:acetylornithine deacetylase/succinyl-diaminopimelate desuccinylase-like protein
MMVHLSAVSELLQERPDLPLRITFVIEGEEEIGSPGLPAVLRERADQLRGDFILLSDTLNPSDDQVAITIGLRGMMCFEFEVSGPRSDLHSGMYGGAVLNPIKAAADLCASLHGSDGRVAIPGFYDAVVERATWECEEIARNAPDAATFCAAIGIPAAWTPEGRTPAEAVRLEPTLEFNGIYGGYTGAGEKTIIPSKATVKVSCRLVANQDPLTIRDMVFAALRERCPAGVRLQIREGHHGLPYSVVPPGRPNTPSDQNPHLAKAFQAADAAIDAVFGSPPLYLPEGGSIPIIGEMKNILGMDCLMLGIGTAANNLHAPNESILLETIAKGSRVSRRILEAVAAKG